MFRGYGKLQVGIQTKKSVGNEKHIAMGEVTPIILAKHPRCQRRCFEASASRNTNRHFPEISELTARGSKHIANKQYKA